MSRRRNRLNLAPAPVALGALALLLTCAAPALAGTATDQRPLLFGFDGAGSSIGALTAPEGIAIDESTGDVYVNNQPGSGKGPGPFDPERIVCKFDIDGNPQNFTAGNSAGKSCLDGRETPGGAFGVEGSFEQGAFKAGVAVDNSGANPGRIYIAEEGGPIHAFAPSGTYLWTLPRATARPCGIAVDREGHLWVGNGYGEGEDGHKVLEFANSGGPPAKIGEFTVTGGNKRACYLGMDESGKDFYVQVGGSTVDKYAEETFDSTHATQEQNFGLTVDASKPSGHIFIVNAANFEEYEPCATPACFGTTLGGSPFGADLIGSARGIAYNPSEDRVYVSDLASNTVKVFGPRASGTVPDVTIGETDEIGQNAARVHGTLNPQSVPNSYRFEYKVGEGASWGLALASPAVCLEPAPPLAEDSADHAVACKLLGLKANTTYQVRLVGENTENNLKAYSAPATFKTLPPPVAKVEGCSISTVSTSSAHVACTVDPQKDQTTWKALRSPQPDASQSECKGLKESAFTVGKEDTIPAEEAGTVPIAADLEGLQYAETNCVRIVATNGGGTSTVDLIFTTTTDHPPSELETAFVAPRTDTTARLNGRLNPEGDATFSYRFELSTDGVDWTLLPVREASVNGREKVVVADQIGGLNPDTTYHYRLASAENIEGGGSATAGKEKTFTTRMTAEVTLPPSALGQPGKRGIELVNNPDKGDQNALAVGPQSETPPLSADGNTALWSVYAGAPGANTGLGAPFLADRSAGGWHSKSLVPSTNKQIGGGEFAYLLENATPDFSHFILQAGKTDVFLQPPITVLRLDRDSNQEILATKQKYDELKADLSDDATDVLTVNRATNQLEDIGSGSAETISLMPGGSPSTCGVSGFTSGGGAGDRNWRPNYHRIAAADASRVYFEVKPDGKCATGHEGLYVRDRESEETTLIDPGTASSDSEIIRSSADGRHAYFVTHSKLDPADKNVDADVYRWDEDAEGSSCLTCAVSVDAKVGVGGNEVVVSDDLSHVYFSSTEQLVPGRGQKGRANVYALSGGQLRFVTDATPASVSGGLSEPENSLLSADGNVLAFTAYASRRLSADEVAPRCTALKGRGLDGFPPCEELYRYDDRDGSVECLSCARGGLTTHMIGTPTGSSDPKTDFQLSADGSTVAFTTQERLLAGDVNNDTDIYEWRNGVVRLITDGVSDFQEGEAAPQVAAVDASGANILFAVVEPGLTGFEQDGLVNIYDARIGGGFRPPAPQAHCSEDSCQGPLRPPPPQRQSSSSSFSGSGNAAKGQAKLKCAKGKVRRKGRCASRHPHKRHHRRASHAEQGRTK
ncbi:MAG TPA: hypothetical protein VK471_10710 [Solirubrobacterales bacterium]|nr:hypothetical protein [Solirubrobacterales bacterium]